ncbi:hypothetical protein [Pelagicoccus sp. SDUM812002]|uniref:hypothetical protein n=1 Tax=Pelagicoccus sp. SDUM812002 TaxID=3041266 RepID=UPI0028100E27|nr:hypothetical protein [Pelagicoccus sp. SDUM812002]MDQ8188515.1 hypothetical protein [Pelagicoccus sp. SDUM812002]
MKGHLLILIGSSMVAGTAITFAIYSYIAERRISTVIGLSMTAIGMTLTCIAQARSILKLLDELNELKGTDDSRSIQQKKSSTH